MRTTTVRDLATAFTTTIRGITPSTTEHQSYGFRPVEDPDQVQGGEIRTFYVELRDPVPIVKGIYSPSAIEHAATALVWMAYGNIRRQAYRGHAAEDGRQIWMHLAVLQDTSSDPSIAGLVSIEHDGWQDEDDEQGRFWGAHVYTIRFLASGLPGVTS